jgi:gamma-glutamyltranspeptidase/glutathione hydrolase
MLENGDTTYLCVADPQGNMVSLIQSVFWEFGSGYAVAGFALQNRGALFNLDPDHANALQPGKRPFHTIIPAFATRDGEPWMAFGVMGGSMQPQGHAQILINLIDFDMDLQQAGDFARFRHAESSQPTGAAMVDGGILLLEPSVPGSLPQALASMGHRIQIGGSFGGYQAIARDPVTGVYSGATESRKDGLASGY